MKKGIVVFVTPQMINQFLWYYCTYGKYIEWHAYTLPNANGEKNIIAELCRKLGIFNDVSEIIDTFNDMSLLKKIALFIKMTFYSIFGVKKSFCKKTLKNYFSDFNFDIAVINNDFNLISGMITQFSKKKEIVILEDGTADYYQRKYSNVLRFHNWFHLQGIALSLLGVANTGFFFPLRTTKDCIKFSSHPELMKYKKYKQINCLYDMHNTDKELLKKYHSAIYPNFGACFTGENDLLFFSTPLQDYVSNPDIYITQVENLLKKNFKSIILKRHPRDKSVYDFGKDVSVSEIDQKIPAEAILPYISKDMKIIFMDISSILLHIDAFVDKTTFLYFAKLRVQNSKELNSKGIYPTEEEFCKKIENFTSKFDILKIE